MQETYRGGVVFALVSLRNWLEAHDVDLSLKQAGRGVILPKKANATVREIITAFIDGRDVFIKMGDATEMRVRRDNGKLEVVR